MKKTKHATLHTSEHTYVPGTLHTRDPFLIAFFQEQLRIREESLAKSAAHTHPVWKRYYARKAAWAEGKITDLLEAYFDVGRPSI